MIGRHADHRRPVACIVILIGGRQSAARLGQQAVGVVISPNEPKLERR